MKKRLLSLFFGLLLFALPALAEGPFLEGLEIDLHPYDLRGGELLMSAGGSLIIAGSQRAMEGEIQPSVLLPIDPAGEIPWHMTKHEDTPSRFYSPLFLSDETIVVLQYTEASDTPWVAVHVDQGTITGMQTITPGTDTFFPQLFPATDGYYVFSGARDVLEGIETITFPSLALMDQARNVQWTHDFDDHAIYLHGVLPLADGALCYGTETILQTGNEDRVALILRIDAQGEILWRKEIPGDNWPAITELAQTPQGNYLALGIATRTAVENGEALPSRRFSLVISPEGEVISETERPAGTPTYVLRSLRPTADGFIALAANGEYGAPLQLVLLDDDGNLTQEYPIDMQDGQQPTLMLTASADGFYLVTWHGIASGSGLTGLRITPIDPAVAQPAPAIAPES